ncbi:MAG: electron transport complex subunit RsxC [Bacteroidales bacterium]|nr:electron transport complex subunit RsxC [Bacteroidales bacterium]
MMQIESHKSKTKGKDILSVVDPELFKITLAEKFGSKPKPIVQIGETVKKYQMIARSEEGYLAPAYAPVSGVIEKIEKSRQLDDSEALTIFLRNDRKDISVEDPLSSQDARDPESIRKIIEKAGIVGMGGAEFPAALKYDLDGKKVDTFIINGAECEPYLTSDYSLMKRSAAEILEGIHIIDKILNADKIVLAIEKHNEDLKEVFDPLLEKEIYKKISIEIVPDEYPQGGELQLTKTITGIEIANGDVPLEKGVIVSNVGTVYAVYEAVVKNKPVIERVITLSGESVRSPGNYVVKIGTPVEHILENLSINVENKILVSGGPMMSPHLRNVSAPINKGTLGILVLPKENINRLNCIWCGYCVDVCPMYLMPMKYDQFYRQRDYKKMEAYNIEDCIECASCEYICPSNVPLMESILNGKNKLKN